MNMIKYATAVTTLVGMFQLTSIPAQADQANEIDNHGDKATVAASRLVEARIVRVPYGDLDITSAAGIQTLTHRIKMGVKRVCGARPEIKKVPALWSWKACQEQAFSDAMAQVDNLVSRRKLAVR